MKLDQLKSIWQEEISTHHEVTQLKVLRERVERHDLRIKIHWSVEILGSLFVIYWFARDLLLRDMHWIANIGAGVVVLAAINIIVNLMRSQRLNLSADATLVDRIDGHIVQKRSQYSLLKNVAWWYIAPLMLGVFLYSYGLNLVLTEKFLPPWVIYAYWCVCAVGCWAIYRLNLASAEKNIKPLIEQLEGLREELRLLAEG